MTHERDQDRELERAREVKRASGQARRPQLAPGKISSSSLMRPPPPRDQEACDKMQALGAQMIRAWGKPDELDAVLTQMEELAAQYRPQVEPELAQDLVSGRRIHLMPRSQIAPGLISVSGLMSSPEPRVEHEAARDRYGADCHDDILLQIPEDMVPGRMSVSSYLRQSANPTPSALARPPAPADPAEGRPHQDAPRAGAKPGTPAAPERLPRAVLERMERHFGTTFAEVELRTNSHQVTGSKAHAMGNEVHLAPGSPQPGTVDGDRILAHELAHLVQLRGGGGRLGTRDDLEAEADRVASQVARGERAQIELSAPAGVYAYTEGTTSPQGSQNVGAPGVGTALLDTTSSELEDPQGQLVARIGQIHTAIQTSTEQISAVVPAYTAARDALDAALVAGLGAQLLGTWSFASGAAAALQQLVPQAKQRSVEGTSAADDLARASTIDGADPKTSNLEDRLRRMTVAIAEALTPHCFRGQEVVNAPVVVDIMAIPRTARINRLYGELERTVEMLELVRDLREQVLHEEQGLDRADLDAARARLSRWASRPLDLAFLRVACGPIWDVLDASATTPVTAKPSELLGQATRQAAHTGWLGDVGRFDLDEACAELRFGGRESAEAVLLRLYTADPDTRARLLMRVRERGLLDKLCSAVGWQDIKDLHDNLGYGYGELKTELQHYFLGSRRFGPSLGEEWENHDSSLHSLIAQAGAFGDVANFVLDVGTFGFSSRYGKALDDRSRGFTSERESRAAKRNAAGRAAVVAAVSLLTGGLAGQAVRGGAATVPILRASAAGATGGSVGAVSGLGASDAYGLLSGEQQQFSSLEEYVKAALLGGVIGGAIGGGHQALQNWRVKLGAAGEPTVIEPALLAVDPEVEAFATAHPRVGAAASKAGLDLRTVSQQQRELLGSADALVATGDIHGAIKLFDELTTGGVPQEVVAQIESEVAKLSGRTSPQVYRHPRAVLPNGQTVEPSAWGGRLFYGTNEEVPEVVFERGLLARGDNTQLLDHVHQHHNSAFRGGTRRIFEPGGIDDAPRGAGAWAGEDGYVYEIDGTPSWDVNALLDGRIRGSDGRYQGNPMRGELEHAVLANVPRERIIGAHRIVSRNGRLSPGEFIPNPHYRPLK